MIEPFLRNRDSLPALPEMFRIPIDCIEHDPDQPRVHAEFEAIRRLAKSLLHHGQLQPIVVRPTGEPGRYRLVCGERRWRAAMLAQRDSILAVVRDVERLGEDTFALQLIENSLREDLAPMDRARAYRSLMERRDWNASELADALHLHRGTVSRVLALLDLPEDVQEQVRQGQLAPDVARELSKMEDPAARSELAEQAAAGTVDRRAVIAKARRSAPPPAAEGDVTRERVFEVEGGRVTILLDRPGNAYDFAAALTGVAVALQAELGGSNAA